MVAEELRKLARRHGIQTRWEDLGGETRTVPAETLLAVLRALDVPVASAADVDRALAEPGPAAEPLDAVTVLWEDRPLEVPIRAKGPFACRLVTEAGEVSEWRAETGPVALPADLQPGYHDFEIAIRGRSAATRLIRAPRRAWDPGGRLWGTFLPLYALRTRRSRAVGDFGDLDTLVRWTSSLGGRAVGTLPLLSAFLSEPFDPSPYAPVSRLFWNELYVDVVAAPGLERSAARRILESDQVRRRIAAARRRSLVDYREAYALQRRVLDALAADFHAADDRPPSWTAFLEARPEAEEYARFRGVKEAAAGNGRGPGGEVAAGGPVDPEDGARTHLYAQWLAHEQLGRLAAADHGAGLYLDLPLGVHPDGFDAWRWRELFATGVAVGAPPDDFFEGGQNWGFPPLHPRRARADGYRYVAAAIGHLCAHADVLRLDHVMALHRLWWVPSGRPATDGAYVGYPAEELWAILCLESNRHRTMIVGEDLGTVPDEVRSAMREHRASRMVVVPFQLETAPRPELAPVPELAAGHLDTHDTPTFAAWWKALEPEGRRALAEALVGKGALDRGEVEAIADSSRPRPALKAALRFLSNSEARLVIVNLEDLWLEEEPQNRPGTTAEEAPNWRRRARYAFETFRDMPEVKGQLEAIDRFRKREPDR